MSTGDSSALARQLADLADADRFSGSVLVTRGNETVFECAAGWADRAYGIPLTPASRFGLASMSKMFTAAAVVSCVRDGLLAPHDRVSSIVPEQRRPQTMPDEVTVHHLLTHTSGIGDYAEEDEDVTSYVEDYAALWAERPSYRMERPLDFLPMYTAAPPVMAPGTQFHYSNAGYVLLGQVLEEVTGQPVIEAITERVLVPARMASSGFLRLDEAHANVATGYLPRAQDEPWRSNVFSIPVVGGGDGGALAAARDIDRFLRCLTSGDLLGERCTTLMRSPHVQISDSFSMGYGLFVKPDGSLGHGGGDPGIETMTPHWPDRDVTLVVLCNLEEGLEPVWDLLLDAGLDQGRTP